MDEARQVLGTPHRAKSHTQEGCVLLPPLLTGLRALLPLCRGALGLAQGNGNRTESKASVPPPVGTSGARTWPHVSFFLGRPVAFHESVPRTDQPNTRLTFNIQQRLNEQEKACISTSQPPPSPADLLKEESKSFIKD